MKELWWERRLARQQHRHEADRDVLLAWQIQRVKLSVKKQGNQLTLGPPSDFLAKRGPAAHSPTGQVAILHRMAAQHGLPVWINGKLVIRGEQRDRPRPRRTRSKHRTV